MSAIVTPEQKKLASKLKMIMATYNESEDLINIGAYKAGANKNIDYAISKIDEVNAFLMQDTSDKFSFEDTLEALREIFENEEG